jgi:hypothetical protein
MRTPPPLPHHPLTFFYVLCVWFFRWEWDSKASLWSVFPCGWGPSRARRQVEHTEGRHEREDKMSAQKAVEHEGLGTGTKSPPAKFKMEDSSAATDLPATLPLDDSDLPATLPLEFDDTPADTAASEFEVVVSGTGPEGAPLDPAVTQQAVAELQALKKPQTAYFLFVAKHRVAVKAAHPGAPVMWMQGVGGGGAVFCVGMGRCRRRCVCFSRAPAFEFGTLQLAGLRVGAHPLLAVPFPCRVSRCARAIW